MQVEGFTVSPFRVFDARVGLGARSPNVPVCLIDDNPGDTKPAAVRSLERRNTYRGKADGGEDRQIGHFPCGCFDNRQASNHDPGSAA